jgi:hypothetical protein
MKRSTDGGRWSRVVRALFVAPFLCLCIAHAQSGKDARDEVFEKVDPWTSGAPAALDACGYLSFGPFPWCEGVKTADIDEVLGTRVLWVETAHFKLGSTLPTYKLRGDKREDARLKSEIDRLAARHDKFQMPKGRNVDPWLRLHLYALRIEDAYADFVRTFGIDEKEFARKTDAADRTRPYLGEGPFLGQPMKLTVLLVDRQSSLGRYTQRYLKRSVDTSLRERLPGGSMFLGVNAESLEQYGFELDAALASTVVSEITFNLVDGFRNTFAAPYWFRQGLAHRASRALDERFTLFAAGTMRQKDDDSWKWEPRVFGLVSNGYVPAWSAMAAWTKWEDLNAQGHMTAWSRTTWLLGQKEVNRRALLMEFTEPLPQVSGDERAKIIVERQPAVMKKALGMEHAELDQAWRQFVLKTYSKR